MDTSTITSKAEGGMREDSIYAIPPGPLRNIRALNNAIGLSPMSEIAFLVSDNLVLNNNGGSTPVTAKAKPRFIDQNEKDEFYYDTLEDAFRDQILMMGICCRRKDT
ncbi:unnamed protein product [Diamesa tonsa]